MTNMWRPVKLYEKWCEAHESDQRNLHCLFCDRTSLQLIVADLVNRYTNEYVENQYVCYHCCRFQLNVDKFTMREHCANNRRLRNEEQFAHLLGPIRTLMSKQQIESSYCLREFMAHIDRNESVPPRILTLVAKYVRENLVDG